MIKIDISELGKAHRLDDDDAALESVEALMGIAHTLARGSSVQAFCLLVATVGHFAAETDAHAELLDLALNMLDHDRDQLTRSLLALVTSHDPTGSPIDGDLQFVMGDDLPSFALDAHERARAYEVMRAAEPDPRDEDDLETGGPS